MEFDMREYYINERYAGSHGGIAVASNINTDGYDARYVSVEDIIDVLQNEANVTAAKLMTGEINPSSPENEFDRRYYIGRWDKLIELMDMFKNGN